MDTSMTELELLLKQTADNIALKAYMDKVNSITKYPSIPTLFKLGPKGDTYLPELLVSFEDYEFIYQTEKIDGCNIRIVFLPENGGIVVGMRDELLVLNGDTILSQSYEGSFVERYRQEIDELVTKLILERPKMSGNVETIYLEMYGGVIGNGRKNYTRNIDCVGFRIFDIASVDGGVFKQLMMLTTAKISEWRKYQGPCWKTVSELRSTLTSYKSVQTVPEINGRFWRMWKDKCFTRNEGFILLSCYDQLKDELRFTKTKLDSSGLAAPEGVVLRNEDRSKIAKIRFETLEKTFRVNEQKRRK